MFCKILDTPSLSAILLFMRGELQGSRSFIRLDRSRGESDPQVGHYPETNCKYPGHLHQLAPTCTKLYQLAIKNFLRGPFPFSHWCRGSNRVSIRSRPVARIAQGNPGLCTSVQLCAALSTLVKNNEKV